MLKFGSRLIDKNDDSSLIIDGGTAAGLDNSNAELKDANINPTTIIDLKSNDPKSELKNPANNPSRKRKTGGVALALGGGGARGWAHIGVLKAIDEVGIPISMIAGTSIGALTGSCYLSDTLDELEHFARSLTKSSMLRYMDFTLRASGIISGDKLGAIMNQHLEGVTFEDLNKPFVAVSTDINQGHEVWLKDGPLVPAVRASYALPGVFLPVEHMGRQLVDGALVNPVPVSVCRSYEPDVVIAINLNSELFGRATVVQPSFYDIHEQEITEMETKKSGWLPFVSSNSKAKQNQLGIMSVMFESFNIIQDRVSRARLAGDPPDYTVRPKLKNVSIADFYKAEEAIELGYNEMMHRVKELENQGVLDTL